MITERSKDPKVSLLSYAIHEIAQTQENEV